MPRRAVSPTMLAARIVATGRLACDEVDVPEPAPGLALVRTLVASICGSDLHVVDLGYYDEHPPPPLPGAPGFPGHESVVEVVEAPGGELAPGQLALAVPPAHVSAAYAEYQTVATSSLVPLQTTAHWEPFVLAQQLGTVIHAMNVFWPGSLTGRSVAIVGAGSGGIMFALEARRRAATTVVIADPCPARLAVARRAGADHVVDTGSQSLEDVVMDLTGGQGAPLAIDASGTDGGRQAAIGVLEEEGTLGMFGLPARHGPSPFDVSTLFQRRARVIAAHSAQREPGLRSFRAAVDRIAGGELSPLNLLSHPFGLEEIEDAFAVARKRGAAIKIPIVVGAPSK